VSNTSNGHHRRGAQRQLDAAAECPPTRTSICWRATAANAFDLLTAHQRAVPPILPASLRDQLRQRRPTKRVGVATIELDDRKWGLLGRFGRQSRNSDGVLGTY